VRGQKGRRLFGGKPGFGDPESRVVCLAFLLYVIENRRSMKFFLREADFTLRKILRGLTIQSENIEK